MSRISDSRDPGGIGIPILRHHGYKNAGFSVDLRGGLLGAIVQSRDDFGAWKRPINEDSVGDWQLWYLWPRASRPISSFAQAWPVVVTKGSQGIIATGQAGACTPDGALKTTLLPIYDATGAADLRYRAYAHQPGTGWQQKNPVGTRGIVLAGTVEDRQDTLFFPCDSRLVAPYLFGENQMSTPVFELNQSGGYDEDFFARLLNFWRVLRPRGGPLGFANNVLAWHIGSTLCDNDAHGLVWDKGRKAGAVLGIVGSGPLDVGTQDDQHGICLTKDGERVNSSHNSTNTYFRMDKIRDGPILFLGQNYSARLPTPKQPPVTNGLYYTPVDIRFDPNVPHEHITGPKDGVWRAWARQNIYQWTPQEFPGRCKPPADPKPRPPLKPGQTPTPNGSIVPPNESPDVPPITSEEAGLEPGNEPIPRARTTGFEPQSFVSTTLPFATGVQLVRPQMVTKPAIDMRRLLELSRERICEHDKETPVVLRLESMGNEGGRSVNTIASIIEVA